MYVRVMVLVCKCHIVMWVYFKCDICCVRTRVLTCLSARKDARGRYIFMVHVWRRPLSFNVVSRAETSFKITRETLVVITFAARGFVL